MRVDKLDRRIGTRLDLECQHVLTRYSRRCTIDSQPEARMKSRLNSFAVAPEAMKALMELEDTVAHLGLEPRLMHLVKLRASQINRCAYCIHMHSKDARAAGESEERLYLLDAWRESPGYTQRERAALGWTESLTLVAQTGADDASYEELEARFTPEERVHLTLLIGMINVWNRLCVGFRSVPRLTSHAAQG
jgi:AhpD family alkylhydroperoxidase